MKTTMKNKYLLFAAAALTLTACSNDDENLNGGPVAAQVTAGIGGVRHVHPVQYGKTATPSAFPPQASPRHPMSI